MGDFSSKQPRPDSGAKTTAKPQTSGTPKTGFDESPKGERLAGGPGPGVGNSRRGIK